MFSFALNGFGFIHKGVEERVKDVMILIRREVASPFPIEGLFFN